MIRYYYSKKSNRILAFHPAGEIEVFEFCEAADSAPGAHDIAPPPSDPKPAAKKVAKAPPPTSRPSFGGLRFKPKPCCGSVGARHKKDCPGVQESEDEDESEDDAPTDDDDDPDAGDLIAADKKTYDKVKGRQFMDVAAADAADQFGLTLDTVNAIYAANSFLSYWQLVKGS